MRRFSALVAALLLPSTPPLLIGTAVSTANLLLAQTPAQAQVGEAVAKVAQTITVRIEGATQGSGVLVKRDSNRYTVLTAWHVVSGQRPGEELDVYTPDGQRHLVEQGSIKRLGDVDMAVLSFSSPNSYELARIGGVKSISMGSPIFVGGFPLPSSAVPTRLLRFLKGDVIANATVAIPNGYQLLYSNQTLPGMSGGAVLNGQGQLVGIHGQGETDSKMTEQQGVAVKTGTNQAVPITYYSEYSAGAAVVASSSQATTADDYLVKAKDLLVVKGKENELIYLANKSIALRESATAFWLRARARQASGDIRGAVQDWSRAAELEPDTPWVHFNLGNIKSDYGDRTGAISAYGKAISLLELIQSRHGGDWESKCFYGQGCLELLGDALFYRAKNLGITGDTRAALADYSRVISLAPNDGMRASAFYYRAEEYFRLGNLNSARADCRQAVNLTPDELLSKSRSLLLIAQDSATVHCSD